MPQRGNVVPLRTRSTEHFTDALAQDQVETESLPLAAAIAAGLHSRSIIRHLIIYSVQNLAWEVLLYRQGTFAVASIDAYSFLSRWRFPASDGIQVAGVGPYCYVANNIDVPYDDDALSGRLHVMLANRSAGAKLAGADGAVVLELHLEPTYG